MPMKFTQAEINKLTKAGTYAGYGADKGINIRVHKSGFKSWCLHFTMPNDSKVIRMGLEKSYPEFTIKDIRPIVRELRRQIAMGTNPKEEREKEKAKRFATVEDMLDAYELIKSQPPANKELGNTMSSLRLNTQTIKDMLLKDVTAEILREQVYQPITDRGSASALIQFKSYLQSAFNRVLEWDNYYTIKNKPQYNFAITSNPVLATRLKDGKEPKGKARDRFLTLQEIHNLVNSPHIQPILKLKIKLIISLGQRIKQIVQSPISAIDFKQGTWAWLLDDEGRPVMKHDYDPDNNNHNHIIPLTDFHIKLIKQNMAMTPSYNGWLFPKELYPYATEPMTTTMRPIGKHCEKMGMDKPFQARDFRRTFKTQGNEILHIPLSSLNAVQHHADNSVAGTTYDWSKHMHEKWDALKKWSDLMEEVYQTDWKEEESDNVVESPWRKAI